MNDTHAPRTRQILHAEGLFDLFRLLVNWVEQDRAPERIVGTRYADNDPSEGVVMTRPFCPYPQFARYTGSGSTDDAANFVCTDP